MNSEGRGARPPRAFRPSDTGIEIPRRDFLGCLPVFREGAENRARVGRAPFSILKSGLNEDANRSMNRHFNPIG